MPSISRGTPSPIPGLRRWLARSLRASAGKACDPGARGRRGRTISRNPERCVSAYAGTLMVVHDEAVGQFQVVRGEKFGVAEDLVCGAVGHYAAAVEDDRAFA